MYHSIREPFLAQTGVVDLHVLGGKVQGRVFLAFPTCLHNNPMRWAKPLRHALPNLAL